MRQQCFAVAMWLLRNFNAGPHAEAIAGDLVERLGEGRTMSWFWRQVAVALVIGTWRDVCDHATAVLLGFTVGWAFLWLFVGFVAVPIVEVDRLLFTMGIVDTYSRWDRWHAAAPWLVLSLGFFKAGRLVSLSVRAGSRAAVLTFAASTAAAVAGLLAVNPIAARAPQPGSPLWFPVAFWLLVPFSCMVLGGLLGRRRESRDVSHDDLGVASKSE